MTGGGRENWRPKTNLIHIHNRQLPALTSTFPVPALNVSVEQVAFGHQMMTNFQNQLFVIFFFKFMMQHIF